MMALFTTIYKPVGRWAAEARNALGQFVVVNLAAYFAGKPLVSPIESPVRRQ